MAPETEDIGIKTLLNEWLVPAEHWNLSFIGKKISLFIFIPINSMMVMYV